MDRASYGTTIVVPQRVSDRWRDTELAVAGFLAMYRDPTRRGHAAELRMWRRWCASHDLCVLEDVQRHHIHLYALELEEVMGRKKSTVAHKLSVLAGFYKYCSVEDIIGKDPAAHIRRPKLEYITTREHLDDGELRRFLAHAADAKHPKVPALCRLLVCNALRISEALNANIEDFSFEAHHRTLRIVRKGGKIRRVPISPFVSVAIDRLIDGRETGPVFLTRSGQGRMDRHSASRIVKRVCREIGVKKNISPHCLRHSAITSLLNAGVPIRDVQHFADHSDPRTTSYYDHGRRSFDSNPTYILATFVASG